MTKKQGVSEHLAWLVPLIITLLIAFGQMYSLTQKVYEMDKKQTTIGAEAINKLGKIENRIQVLEHYFCAEVEKCGVKNE
jgi:hypothetical protein